MEDRSKDKLTFARYFLEPSNSTHRRYEALRAYFIDGLPSAQVAARFGYTPGSVRVLVHQFRHDPERPFFVPPAHEIKPRSRQKRLRDRVVALRQQNLSIYEISRTLSRDDAPISPATVAGILKEEGFARLPRRLDEERPPDVRPTTADVADVRPLDLAPRPFRTKFGGRFLFVPARVAAELDAVYSGRIDPTCSPKRRRDWFDPVRRLGRAWGTSFDLDFHTIPFPGEDSLVEKHYVSTRSRRQRGVWAFLAQDADRRVFCYANADRRKDPQNDEILQFVSFWEQRTGRPPAELIFDSRLTTHANLNRLNQKGIRFITLRRRSAKLLRACAAQPASAWRRIELEGVSRAYRTPRVLDQKITRPDYEGPRRQLTGTGLGPEEPTLLITNQLGRSAAPLISRSAQRMGIANGIADGIDFFHLDALSSAVALNVNCDRQLTLLASSLSRVLGGRVGQGDETAKSRHLFRDFIDATATVTLRETDVVVRFQKRAHNPLLLAAGFDETQVKVPWLEDKPLRFVFG